VFALLAAFACNAHALPTDGAVSAGSGSIAQSGGAMTVNQSSQNLAVNWQSFNIGANERVNFVQPNASSIALNRVLGSDPSQILGQLNANGQVWILNPNGLLFGSSAQVNVGGLVASTLGISDADLLAGRRTFSSPLPQAGEGLGVRVVNQGSLNATGGGYIALLGGQISNEGVITARLGTVALAAGKQVTLDFNGDKLLSVQVDQGAVNALAENKQLIQADGGTVLMTAQAADALATAVVNNTGVIEARTIENHNGVIKLLGDMRNGTVNVGGTLDASATLPPLQGEGWGGDGVNGGFVETSAAHVQVADTARITTAAANGKSGTWLIDPVDFTIAASGGDITGAALSTNLAGGNITILSSSGAAGTAGDVNVNDAVTWSVNKLTLNAFNNININSNLNGSGTASLALEYGQGAVAAGNTSKYILKNGVQVNLPAGLNFSTKLGSDGVVNTYTVITALGAAGSVTTTDLQGMSGDLAGKYVLGSNIDATATSTWNASAGFLPVGDSTTKFTGVFDGLGHTITGLTINRPATDYVGLFGSTNGAAISNVGLVGGSVTGFSRVGGLVGYNSGTSTITNSYSTGSVSGSPYVGGLVGINTGTITNSYSTGAVSGNSYVGGLAGYNYAGTITNSYSTGTVTGSGNDVGGLVGINDGTISNSYSTGAVSGGSEAGGLVGYNAGTITNSYSTGAVSGSLDVGGLAGYNYYGTITNSYSTGTVSGSGVDVGGLVGVNDGTITNSYSTGAVSGSNYYVGGLAGYNNTGTITNSYSTGAVSGGNRYVGGLVGWNNTGTITNSYSTGAVSGSNYYVGGLVGVNSAGTISNSYSTGAVSGSNYVGGLVGYNSGTITNSYWDTTTSGTLTGISSGILAGATGLTTAQMKTMASFTGWSIANTGGSTAVWRIYEGYTYPLLKSFLTPLTVTANNDSKTYNGLTYSGGSGVAYSVTPNANLLGTVSYSGTSQTAINPGSYVITPSGLYSNQRGYNISYVDGGLTVNKAALTVTASAAAKTYNGLAYSGGNGVGYTGFVNSETSAVLGGALAYGGTSQGATNAGSYLITPSGLTSGNYTITFANGGLTVNPAALTVTANAATKTYNGTAYTGGNGVGYSGFVNGETSAVLGGVLAYSGTSQNAINAGSYLITPGGQTSGNYTITFANGALTVTPAALTVTANADSKTYNGTTGAAAIPSITSGTLFGADTANFNETYDNANAGAGKTLTASGTVNDGNSGNNYAYTFVTDTTGAINTAALTVTANAASKTYNGLAYSGGNGVSYTGLVNSETGAALGGVLAYGGASQGAINAGNYLITPNGLTSGNYTISYANGALTVNPAALNVTANAASKTYDGLAWSGNNGVSYSGLVNGETSAVLGGALTYGGTSQGATNAGGYLISSSGLTSGNYTISYANGMLTVNTAPLTVTANAASKTYDGLAYSGGNGVSYSGFVNGETSAVLGGALAYGGTSQGAVKPGNYLITPSGLSSGNYTPVYADGKLTVSAGVPTVPGAPADGYAGAVASVVGNDTAAVGNSNGAGLTGGQGKSGGSLSLAANAESLLPPFFLVMQGCAMRLPTGLNCE
jgi:filamentous hemagglutinin family protein